jgi:enamine deaminase RidA (YjgF/YER057c/UK114 family)
VSESGPALDRPPLPAVPPPGGAYAPATRHGDLVVSAGMTPRRHGVLTARGLVGAAVTAEDAKQAAAVAAENALAAVADAAGGLELVRTCLRMTVYVACAEGFVELSGVADGASSALEAHLGPGRRPARAAIGVRSLPGGAPVEVELMVAVGTR